MSFIICSDTEIMVARALTVNSYNSDGWQMESGRSAFNWLFFVYVCCARHSANGCDAFETRTKWATEFDLSAHSVIPSFVARNK